MDEKKDLQRIEDLEQLVFAIRESKLDDKKISFLRGMVTVYATEENTQRNLQPTG